MTPELKKENGFNQTEDSWLKHSNPVLVWTWYAALPLIVFAFWSRKWIGCWCLAPGSLLLVWSFVNPIFFKKPKSTRNWASKTVLGERVFLNRDKIKIPDKHDIPLHAILKIIASTGMILMIWSTVYYSIWGAILGAVLAYVGKSWFWDRMVWLFEDMKNENEIYKSWDY